MTFNKLLLAKICIRVIRCHEKILYTIRLLFCMYYYVAWKARKCLQHRNKLKLSWRKANFQYWIYTPVTIHTCSQEFGGSNPPTADYAKRLQLCPPTWMGLYTCLWETSLVKETYRHIQNVHSLQHSVSWEPNSRWVSPKSLGFMEHEASISRDEGESECPLMSALSQETVALYSCICPSNFIGYMLQYTTILYVRTPIQTRRFQYFNSVSN